MAQDICSQHAVACAGLQGSSKHLTEEDMTKVWSLQRGFKTKIMESKRLMKTARSQFKQLLFEARYHLHFLQL